MKVIKIKHVGFLGLLYLFVLLLPLISTIIGARYQVMINNRESKSVNEVKQIRESCDAPPIAISVPSLTVRLRLSLNLSTTPGSMVRVAPDATVT